MKKSLLVLICLLTATISGYGQSTTPAAPVLTNIYGVGVSYNQGANPSISGTGLYAHTLNDSGTYVFSVIDILPNTLTPFTVSTNLGAGVAQKVLTTGTVSYYLPTTAGISITGANTGWAWTAGGMAVIPVKSNLYLMPTVRVLKSSVTNGTGYQPIVGLLLGWR